MVSKRLLVVLMTCLAMVPVLVVGWLVVLPAYGESLPAFESVVALGCVPYVTFLVKNAYGAWVSADPAYELQ